MKTIDEIMKVTECNLEQAEKLYNELINLPEELGNFMSDHLDVVNAFDADEIKVIRHDYDSVYLGYSAVKRVSKDFPTFLDGRPNCTYWYYCFDCLLAYTNVSVL